jgi:hypothetical protein
VTAIYEMASNNLVVAILAVAGILALCGYQAYRHEHRGAARAWWIWSALILLVQAVSLVFSKKWTALGIICIFLTVNFLVIVWFGEDPSIDDEDR